MIKKIDDSNMEGDTPFQKYVNYLLTSIFVGKHNCPSDECLMLAERIELFLSQDKENKILDLLINQFYREKDGWGNVHEQDYDLSELLDIINTLKEKYNEMSVQR